LMIPCGLDKILIGHAFEKIKRNSAWLAYRGLKTGVDSGKS
jgi:hypothetical protein